MLREIMTPEQVAEYLQLNLDTVYRLIRQNQLAASHIGRTYRIPKGDVEDFLLSHSSRPQVRKALFDRVMDIARNNPGLNSDDVLDELEQLDLDRKAKQQPAKRG
ncbi:MAG TPA: helix-turn-helix domain-containing protein [Chloroflexota bacterium]|nr:helix-turn-helix domain-containing protein [Chloroflexota bacterium]